MTLTCFAHQAWHSDLMLGTVVLEWIVLVSHPDGCKL